MEKLASFKFTGELSDEAKDKLKKLMEKREKTLNDLKDKYKSKIDKLTKNRKDK